MGDSTLGGIPKHCRIKTTWALCAPEKLGGPPILLETLALYSYMTFGNAKVAIFNNKRSKQFFYPLNSNYGRKF